MSPEIAVTDWITSIAAVAAVLAASFFAWRQISIYNRQASLLDKQADILGRQAYYQGQQTTISKRQAEISQKQTNIAEQQLSIIKYQEQERRKERGKANLIGKITHRKTPHATQIVLQIDNRGPLEARNITILLDDKPINEHNAIMKHPPDVRELHLPVGSCLEYQVKSCDPPYLILDMKWSDNSGEPGHTQIPLRAE